MVKVAGAVGRPTNVGLVGREGKGGDGSSMAATGIRSNPRRAFLQGIDVLLSERVSLLTGLAHGGPSLVEFSGGRKVAPDGNKSSDESGKDDNTEKSERCRVGDHPDEQAREI